MLVVAISSLFKMSPLWWLTLLTMGVSVLGVEVLPGARSGGVRTRGIARLRGHGKGRGSTRKAESLSVPVTVLYILLIYAYQPFSWTRTFLCKPSGCTEQTKRWSLTPMLRKRELCWGVAECDGRAWSNERPPVLFKSFTRKGKASQQQLQ